MAFPLLKSKNELKSEHQTNICLQFRKNEMEVMTLEQSHKECQNTLYLCGYVQKNRLNKRIQELMSH